MKRFGGLKNPPYLCQTKNPNTMKPLSKLDYVKMDRRATREFLMGEGKYNIHKEKVYRDKKMYTRKEKHKPQYDETNI